MLPGKYMTEVTAEGVTVHGEADIQATMGIEPIDTTIPVGAAGSLTTEASLRSNAGRENRMHIVWGTTTDATALSE